MTDDWDVVFQYLREQAIEDGVLIAVDRDMAREAGFMIPIALTAALYDKYILSDLPGQSEEGRLWDTLWMLRIQAFGCDSNTVHFDVIYQMEEDKSELVKLKAIIGPGDKLEDGPFLTIMFPFED